MNEKEIEELFERAWDDIGGMDCKAQIKGYYFCDEEEPCEECKKYMKKRFD